MPIQVGPKGATLFGADYPPFAYIDWFTPDQEAIARQGGDAYNVPARGFTKAQEDALKGVVSVAGNLAAAAVSSTSGTPGEVRRISDGDNAGALVVWAIPQGASTYTWCWWLWPQAAY